MGRDRCDAAPVTDPPRVQPGLGALVLQTVLSSDSVQPRGTSEAGRCCVRCDVGGRGVASRPCRSRVGFRLPAMTRCEWPWTCSPPLLEGKNFTWSRSLTVLVGGDK